MRASFGLLALGLIAGCDYSGDWLFASPSGAPGVVHLGELVPAVIDSPEDIQNAIVYGEVGATGTAESGGVTFSFIGNGGSVCIWVDPELVYWNQSVAAVPDATNAKWRYPDNPFDDGDLDLYAGFAVYYSGSPGERMGDFEIRYEDSLGNQIPVDFNECTIGGLDVPFGAHAGRGSPESCTLTATAEGVSYIVAMDAWSTPLDDNRLAYGLLVAEGSCSNLRDTYWGEINDPQLLDECVILGEARDEAGEVLNDSENFELAFCTTAAGGDALVDYCETEAETYDCDVDHCFCGDPNDTPDLLD